ncbi:MAG: ATPase, T2SS/T4P/T4SS family [bacterium]|nr:ATPase, T2SS/T4P/T4SS family [bacterium]
MEQEQEKETGWLKQEFLSEDEARRNVAYTSGIPFVILSRDDISPESFYLIPEPLSRAHNIVAYHHDGESVEVMLLDINDLSAVDFLRVKIKVKPRLTNRDSLKQALLMYQKQLKEKFAGLVEKGVEAADSLLRHALHSNATHIHLEPAAAALLVRYRINGILHEAMRLPEHAKEFIQQQIKSLARLFPVTTTAQEGRFRIEHGGEQFTVRVSTVPSVAGEKMLLRLARENHGQKGFTLSALGFHGEGLERLHTLLHQRKGLVVVCGPKESGNTTTLYTLLDELNHPGVALSTIEEKVEYSLPRVSQTQIRSDVGLDLLAGLRAVLRSDPDVVMVSDIRQREVAELAAQSAKRGIFVLAGIEAKSPSKVMDILEPEAPRAIINQRLVRKLCQVCKKSYRPTREELEVFEEAANFGRVLAALKEEDVVNKDKTWKELDFYRAQGCSKCEEGYKGRLGIQEIIEENAEGLTLIEDALFKAVQGLTSIEEVVYLAQ